MVDITVQNLMLPRLQASATQVTGAIAVLIDPILTMMLPIQHTTTPVDLVATQVKIAKSSKLRTYETSSKQG